MLQSVHEIIRAAELNYLQGTTKLGSHVDWSMHETIERIDAYLNSKHISGDKDALDREKPFFNIVSAAVNIWYRATDIDRKDIRFVPTNSKSVILAFVANVILQNWMNEHRYGQFLNSWGRAMARYGSAIAKFVEKDGDLIPSVVPWNRYIADPVQFDALPRIEKFYLTPAQLRRRTEYDQQAVDELIETHTTRKTLDKQQKDTMSDFIELYEVHGELDTRLLDEEPDLNLEDKDIKYRQQMHVVSYVQENGSGGGKGEYKDFTLFKGKEAKDPYAKDDLIEEDGRTLGIGAVEYLFDAQWMLNHTVKNMKDTLDLASKLIFQTADSSFVGRNVLNAIETGDILIHASEKPLTRIANDKPDISALQNYGSMWQTLGQELTSTPDALRGTTMPANTPYSLGAFLGGQANSLFEIMTENKGLAIENHMRDHITPYIKKCLKHKDEIVAVLDDAGITEIDSVYIPVEAVNRYNARAKEGILSGQPVMPFDPAAEQQALKQETGSLGNKRFFKPSELDDMTWDELFSDFEWDSIRVEVTNEQSDKQAVLTTLSSVLQTIATNPLILQDPNARMILGAILNETGKISPIQLTTAASQPVPAALNPTPQVPNPAGGGAQAITSLVQ